MNAPVWSWRDAITKSGMPSAARLVCFAISCDLSDTGKFTRLTVAKLAEMTGLSERSISRHLAEAETVGMLRIERIRSADGYVCGTRYYPRFPDHVELAKEARETLPAKLAGRSETDAKPRRLPAKNDTPSRQIGGYNKETSPKTLPIEEARAGARNPVDNPVRDCDAPANEEVARRERARQLKALAREVR